MMRNPVLRLRDRRFPSLIGLSLLTAALLSAGAGARAQTVFYDNTSRTTAFNFGSGSEVTGVFSGNGVTGLLADDITLTGSQDVHITSFSVEITNYLSPVIQARPIVSIYTANPGFGNIEDAAGIGHAPPDHIQGGLHPDGHLRSGRGNAVHRARRRDFLGGHYVRQRLRNRLLPELADASGATCPRSPDGRLQPGLVLSGGCGGRVGSKQPRWNILFLRSRNRPIQTERQLRLEVQRNRRCAGTRRFGGGALRRSVAANAAPPRPEKTRRRFMMSAAFEKQNRARSL